MITAAAINTTNVTSEQIGRCHKVFSGSIPFYMVESESDSQVEYKVTWDRAHGFRCTCKSGQAGFSNCRHPYCKHVKWSVAAAREEKQAMREQIALNDRVAICDTVGCTHAATQFDAERVEFTCETHAHVPANA